MKKKAFILILLMCTVLLLSLTTFAEVVDIQNKNTALLRGDDAKPVISDELQSKVEKTLSGFTGGFIENKGQKNKAIHYYTESAQMAVGFGTSELRFNIIHPRSKPINQVESLEEPLNEYRVTYTPLTLTFLGSNPVIPVAQESTGIYCHYFRDTDPTKWRVNNQYYTKLIYPNLYEQIDLVYEVRQGQLKYEFFVYPGGKLEDIKLHWTGPVSLQLLEQGMKIQVHRVSNVKGDLAPICHFMDTIPITYQSLARDNPLDGSFKLLGSNVYGFSVPSYDPTKILIIDPLFLTYSTYVSGTGWDFGYELAIDLAGNAYVTGETSAMDFPTVNAYDSSFNGDWDVFVFKLSPNGNNLLYSTYVGGSMAEEGHGIAVNPAGNAYVSGRTYSGNFPTVNAYDNNNNGVWDVFVFKLAAGGSSLLYSTYIGGSQDDFGYGLAIDPTGNAYVTGNTYSTNFPTVNAYNATGDGSTTYSDVFVCKLAANGSSLLYSTYVSGSRGDEGHGIVIDPTGNAYVTGYTYSLDFPTVNAYDATGDGDLNYWDVFIFKLAADGSNLLYSTYVGGSQDDFGYGLAIDMVGNAYVTGYTYSTDFPTVNAYNATGDGSTSFRDVFVFKLAANGSSLLYSTYVSGSHEDEGHGIAVNPAGNAYVTGRTRSTDFPTVNAYNATGDGSNLWDVFVLKLASDGSNLLYSTYLGGSQDDFGYGIVIDSAGNAYVTGYTYSTDFPTVNAYNATGDGNTSWADVFVSKLVLYSQPTSPQGLAVAISADSKVMLIWSEPTDHGNALIIAYRVYRSTTSGVYGSFLAEVTNEAFIDSTAVIGVEYFYVVTAVNSVGESTLSNEVTITIPTPITAPSAPLTLTVTPGDNFVYLSWSVPSSDGGSAIISYHIYRGTSSGDYFFLGVATSTNFNDTTALGGITYFYVVTAVNAVGESGFSNEVSTMPSGSPPGPVTTTVTSTVTTTVTSFTSSSQTTPTISPGFEVIGLVIALTSLMIAAVIYRRRKNVD
ncbi:MAG: SBBP repeat-containing protein [Promethearchaeota archaeon]